RGAGGVAALVVFFLVAAVAVGVFVGLPSVVGGPVVRARLADVDGRREVTAVPVHVRVADGAARHLVRGRAVGPEVEVEGDRAARVGGGPRERRRVGQGGAVDAQHLVGAGIGREVRATRRDDHVLVVAVAAVRSPVVVGVAAVVGDPP